MISHALNPHGSVVSPIITKHLKGYHLITLSDESFQDRSSDEKTDH
ncbi:hypothetical protein [Vulcanisaeta souniana]|nr:hypothetical protein [Vulcanisaeta souniana]